MLLVGAVGKERIPVLLACRKPSFWETRSPDGAIPGTDASYQDALTLIPLPFSSAATSLKISNSVNGLPKTLALSPDGDTAFVVEYMGQRGTGATTRNDLPAGRTQESSRLR